MTVKKEYITVQTISWNKKGKRWPHKHEWVSIHDHPRGGEARFCFMLEHEECEGLEMCLTCLARRVNNVSKNS